MNQKFSFFAVEMPLQKSVWAANAVTRDGLKNPGYETQDTKIRMPSDKPNWPQMSKGG